MTAVPSSGGGKGRISICSKLARSVDSCARVSPGSDAGEASATGFGTDSVMAVASDSTGQGVNSVAVARADGVGSATCGAGGATAASGSGVGV